MFWLALDKFGLTPNKLIGDKKSLAEATKSGQFPENLQEIYKFSLDS